LEVAAMKTKRIHIVAICFTLVLFACLVNAPAHAGNVIGAKITKIRTTEWNVAFIYVDKTITTVANCAPQSTTVQNNVFAVAINTPSGRAMLNAAMLAQAQKKTVSISGRGDYPSAFTGAAICSLWTDVETANFVDVEL
jgi:hypothetical protein